MLLTVSKRLEFSASRRLHVAGWTDNENATAFGLETNARYGSGRNYVAYFVFTGPVDPATGMLINISEIKERAGKVLRDRFDHKFLNQDNPSFREVPPTAENVARQLYVDVAPLFSDAEAKLSVCHLSESPERSATYCFNGACDANYWFEFSAARRTMSPHLSQEERTAVRTRYCTARPQLWVPAHVSSGTTRSQTAFGFATTKSTPVSARCAPNSITSILTK